MPLISSLSAGVRAFGLYVLSALVTVIDTFNRSDNASDLGSAGGQKWKIWRGVWGISTNKASSSTAASSYPLATLTFTRTDVTLGIGTPAPGAGATFWVSDANNWWAATYEQVETCQTCQTCNAYNTSNCNAFGCIGNYNPTVCNGGYFTYCIGSWNATAYSCTKANCNAFANGYLGCNQFAPGNCTSYNNTAPKGFCKTRNPSVCTQPLYYNYCSGGYNYTCSVTANPNCNGFFTTFCNSSTGGNCNVNGCAGTFNPSNCSSFSSYSCDCSTSHKMNIIKSISSVISNVASSTFNAAIGSFKSILSGNNITIQAYQGTTYTTQIGTDWVQSSSGATKNKNHGIIMSPSTFAQGNSIEEFRIE